MALEGLHSSKMESDSKGAYIRAKFLMLSLGELHVKHAVQHRIWVSTQHLLWDQGKPQSLDRVGWLQDIPDAN
jgi:hypothetical protein